MRFCHIRSHAGPRLRDSGTLKDPRSNGTELPRSVSVPISEIGRCTSCAPKFVGFARSTLRSGSILVHVQCQPTISGASLQAPVPGESAGPLALLETGSGQSPGVGIPGK